MSVLVNLMIKIVLMVGLGALLKKTNVITNELQKGISNLLVTAVLPLNIIASSSQELTEESMHGAIFAAIFGLLYYAIALIILKMISRRLNLSESKKKLFITMGAFANTGFIGFPFVEEMFGASTIIYAVIYNLCYQVYFYTYGMYLLSKEGKTNIWTIFKTPVTISSFLAIILFVGQISLPAPVQSAFSTVGAMTVPLSMFAIGCTLVDMNFIEVIKDKYSYLISAIRLLIFPVIAYGILKAFHITGTVASICILITGLPSGSLNVIVAQQQDCEPEFAARAVVQTMILMVISLPFLFWLIQTL